MYLEAVGPCISTLGFNAEDFSRAVALLVQQISLRGVITARAVVHSQHRHESSGCRNNICCQDRDVVVPIAAAPRL
jgi:hypothetical protein